MNVTKEDVVAAYRLFLNREPENEEVVYRWLSSASSLVQLREGFLNSIEYTQRNYALMTSMSGLEPSIRSQLHFELNYSELRQLFAEVKRTWTYLGEVDPYWAVLSSDEFRGLRDGEVLERFYASGADDMTLIKNTLKRNGIQLPENVIVVEYGCGLGRATFHLAKYFREVVGIDISRPMLDVASSRMQANGIQNVTFKLIDAPEDIKIPMCDLFFSLIVLQHSPPPIISLVVRNAIESLNPGGVALFQVPTYIPNYCFTANEYLSSASRDIFKPHHKQYEIHAIRQVDLFNLIYEAGGKMLEVIENNMLGSLFPGAMSNTLLVQKAI